ncbi:putative Heat shock protein DnaJ [Pseudoloma neurophilia]|uniref:Putative Heat shock protein DnaJ n=1 Tax=Pseudoloma neurophilia TaxID=146866 RepID=A0A0R0LZ08_9MICR|nr:putative Heat shock protein DnaJ [Pseudoloma neurophilia]
MKYLNLPKNYSMAELVSAYKCAVKKYHPIKTKTSTHLYKINSEYSQRKSMIRLRDESYNYVPFDNLERAVCQCGHFYNLEMLDGDFIECDWCSIKVHITGRNKIN